MNILEKDLEEIIESTSNKELRKRGLYVYGDCFRQLRIGNYGIADLVYYNKAYDYESDEFGGIKIAPYLQINICELKKEKAGISAFLQAVRYAKGIKSYLNLRGVNAFKIQLTIIAPTIDIQSDYVFLSDLISGNGYSFITRVNNYSVKYMFNGIQFNLEKNYSLTNHGFNIKEK